MTAFVLDAAVRRARAVASGPERRAPRPIGGWTFALPDGWDEAFNDIADLR